MKRDIIVIFWIFKGLLLGKKLNLFLMIYGVELEWMGRNYGKIEFSLIKGRFF